MVKNINQYHRSLMESLKKELESIRIGMLNTPSLELWSEYMDSAITPVLMILYKRMKHIELNTGIVAVGHTAGTSEITALEIKWERKMREVAALIDGIYVFSGGRWFRSHME